MNAILATVYRDVTCALAALAITVALTTAFVNYTAVPPGTTAPHAALVQAA
jgi:hypothetical protein